MEKLNVWQKLIKVQTELKAPKSQYNSFGKYSYRNCEDILEALKPILDKYQATIFITDTIEMIGERYYIRATVTFLDCEDGNTIVNSALAREEHDKKGMDSSQLTGSCSSYARKYALNGMFCIDDTKDADSRDEKKTTVTSKAVSTEEEKCSCCGRKFEEFDWNGKHYTKKQSIHFAKQRGTKEYPLLCGQCAKKINDKKEEVK